MSRYDIYYTKPEHFRGFTFNDDLPKISELENTHRLLRSSVVAADMEEIFVMMQAENWSPNGEARDLIKALDLSHTSMSVWDVVRDCGTDEWFVVANIGFKKMEN